MARPYAFIFSGAIPKSGSVFISRPESKNKITQTIINNIIDSRDRILNAFMGCSILLRQPAPSYLISLPIQLPLNSF